MRMLLALAVLAAAAHVARGRVWTTVYRCDEATPLESVDPNDPAVYREIMVGTHLVIVVSSDTDRYWTGSLRTSWEDAEYGVLSARGYVAKPPNYQDSCLEAAGERAVVLSYLGMGVGYDLVSSANLGLPGHDPVAGDWFVLDYHAHRVGFCDVLLYGYTVDSEVLIETLSFTHVPSRDFNGDAVVDFTDFALLSSRWQRKAELDPNSIDAGLDLDSDHQIDFDDLILFSEYWLDRTDCTTPAIDPNNPADDADKSQGYLQAVLE